MKLHKDTTVAAPVTGPADPQAQKKPGQSPQRFSPSKPHNTDITSLYPNIGAFIIRIGFWGEAD